MCNISFLSNLIYNFSILKNGKSSLLILIPCWRTKNKIDMKSIIKSKKNQIFFIIFEMIFIITISLLFYLSQPILSTKVVYIPKGNISQIITYLKGKNFQISPTLDKYIVRILGKPQSGWIDIGKTRLSRGDFLYKLTKAKAALMDITLIPGETTAIFFQNLSNDLNLSQRKLLDSFSKLSEIPEGAFYPETYHIPKGIEEYHLVNYLLSFSEISHKKLSEKIFGEYNKKKWFNYLIIASIIQKEAASIDEMPLVSSVIYNRLKKGMKLQMDGTLNYGYYSHEKITAKRIKEDTSRYNTYLYKGLPPIPVCNVGVEAIKAAIFPKESDFLYFVRDKATNKHKFSKSYKEHNRAIRKQ